MVEYKDRLQHAMALRGVGKQQLADALSVSYQAVRKVLLGLSGAFNAENNAKAAAFLRVRPDWLAAGMGDMEAQQASNVAPTAIGMTSIPVISYIQAGQWNEVVDPYQPGDGDETIYTDQAVSANTFALRIRGDSMYRADSPDSFSEGDLVIIDPNVQPRPGEYVAAKNCDQEATFKKYRPRGLNAQGVEYFELVPLNPDYETMRSDLQPITIIGTMIEHRRFRRRT